MARAGSQVKPLRQAKARTQQRCRKRGAVGRGGPHRCRRQEPGEQGGRVLAVSFLATGEKGQQEPFVVADKAAARRVEAQAANAGAAEDIECALQRLRRLRTGRRTAGRAECDAEFAFNARENVLPAGGGLGFGRCRAKARGGQPARRPEHELFGEGEPRNRHPRPGRGPRLRHSIVVLRCAACSSRLHPCPRPCGGCRRYMRITLIA